jgi:hypothetical protein
MKVIPADADGTYSLAEIAPVVKIPEGTLFRWRWQALLTTTYDEMVDPDTAFRLAAADSLKEPVRGPMPLARFNVEDCARLRIIGDLGEAGWDRAQLLIALARPYALPGETKGDGHTPVDERQMPEAGVLYKTRKGHLWFQAFDIRDEADAFARKLGYAVVINLDYYRDTVRQELAQVDLNRQKKAARKVKKSKSVKLAETEKV